MAQRPTVTQMSRKFESHAFTQFVNILTRFVQSKFTRQGERN